MPTARQRKTTEERMESRRAATAELARAGHTYRKMVPLLKAAGHRTSLGTIANDLDALTERYRLESFKSREESMLLDLDRMDSLMAMMWGKAVGGDVEATDRVLRIIEQRTRILDYPSIPMRDAPGTVATDSGLTAEEEAMLMRVLHAIRSGRSLARVVEGEFKVLPVSLDDPVPLPPGYGQQQGDG